MSEDTNGLRKSAIVLLALGRPQAEVVLRHLGDDAQELMLEMATAQQVDAADRDDALAEFVHACSAHSNALKAPAVPFSSFHEAETQSILHSIRDEHPQTIALVLAHLPREKAGEVLAGLDSAKQVEVIKRIAGIEQTSSQVIEQVERGLRERLGRIVDQTVRSGGVSAVAEILNSADRRTEREILLSLDHDAPQLADQIRKVQLIFDDLLHASDKDIRAVLDQLDLETVSLALRTARERLVEKTLSNLSREDAAHVERELQSVDAVGIGEIEAAQKRVAEVVEQLRATGEIGASRPARRKPLGRKGEAV